MASPRRSRLSAYEARERSRAALSRAIVTLAGGRARLAIIALAVLFTLWQWYIFAWQPLTAETSLPAGLASVRPQLNVETLTKIRDARVERLQHEPNLFRDADQYFAISSPAPR